MTLLREVSFPVFQLESWGEWLARSQIQHKSPHSKGYATSHCGFLAAEGLPGVRGHLTLAQVSADLCRQIRHRKGLRIYVHWCCQPCPPPGPNPLIPSPSHSASTAPALNFPALAGLCHSTATSRKVPAFLLGHQGLALLKSIHLQLHVLVEYVLHQCKPSIGLGCDRLEARAC